jgi:polar amino acid transport system substrate-binding protein
MTEDRARQVRFSRPVWALADGLMVRAADEERFATYEVIAASPGARLGVVAGQVQALTARRAGIPEDRILAFADPDAVLQALKQADVDAYASVAFAHRGFLARSVEPDLTFSDLGLPRHAGRAGSTPAYGAFSFAMSNALFADAFDAALAGILGGAEHQAIMARHGFTVRDGLGLG